MGFPDRSATAGRRDRALARDDHRRELAAFEDIQLAARRAVLSRPLVQVSELAENERIPVKSVFTGRDYLYELVQEYANQPAR